MAATVPDRPGRVAEELTEARIRELLNQIIDPCSAAQGVPIGLDEMGLVRGVAIEAGEDRPRVTLDLRVTGPGCMMFLDFERQARDLLAANGAGPVLVSWDPTPDWTPADMSASARERLGRQRRNRLSLTPAGAPGHRSNPVRLEGWPSPTTHRSVAATSSPARWP